MLRGNGTETGGTIFDLVQSKLLSRREFAFNMSVSLAILTHFENIRISAITKIDSDYHIYIKYKDGSHWNV